MDGETFTIQGATGVDLTLPIAGPGSRSYAFVIDWHIRLLVALAWFASAIVIATGTLTFLGIGQAVGKLFSVWLPSLLIYFLYHPVLEVLLRGQTPGKRIAGIRIVDRGGGIPSVGALLIRNVFRLIDSLPTLYVVGLVTTVLSAQRLRIGDMAAGTILVFDEPTPRTAFTDLRELGGNPRGDLIVADLAMQILDRWPTLSVGKRAAIGRSLLARVGVGDSAQLARMSDDELRAALSRVARGSGV